MSEHHTTEPPPAPSPPAASFWQAVRQALRGEHHDYTSLPLNRAVLLLAVPMVLEMFMESLFAVADVFWVSRLGPSAVAVIGLTEAVMTLIYAVAIGIAMSATAIVARRTGEKDPEKASHAAGQIVLLGVGLAAGMGIVLAFFAREILQLMGAGAETVALGTDFARIMLGGNITVFLIFLINAIFRGAGDAVIAMRTLWLANGINIVLGPVFIFWLDMGVTGAAVATNIGRGIGVLYQLSYLFGKSGRIKVTLQHLRLYKLWRLFGEESRIKVTLHHLRPDFALLRNILRTAGPGVFQFVIHTTSWIGLTRIIAEFGDEALAGNTIAIRIVIFALMPAWGLANAGATLVGQNLGAQKPERAAEAVWIATRYNAFFLGLIGIVFIVFSRPIAGLFATRADELQYANDALWIVSTAFPLYAAGMCFEGAFNGAGDTWTPTRLNFFCFWLGQVPLAWFLAHPCGLGPIGVFTAVPISFSVLAFWSAFLFHRGKWKLKKV